MAVASVATYASAAGALWLRPGDVATLPDLFGTAFYEVLNERFASVEGNVLTAREPGIVGIRCVDASFATNIMGVVVLPEAIGGGSVYVYDETKYNDYSWTQAATWKKVDGSSRAAAATNDSWPKDADDIAILPFYTRAGGAIRHRTDITIGGLYTGDIKPDAKCEVFLERYKDDTTKTVTFQRTDGEPVRVQVCPNGYNSDYQTQLRLGGYAIDVVWASDAVVDCGSSETDAAAGPVGTFMVQATTNPGVSTNTLRGVTLTIQGFPGRAVNGNTCTKALNDVWKGTGTIVKKGNGGIAFPGDFSGFSGEVIVEGQPPIATMSAPAANVLMRAHGADNISATVYGKVAISASNGGLVAAGTTLNGMLGTGGQASATPANANQAPVKGLTLVGGTYWAGRIDNTTWGKGVKDDKVFDFLKLGSGLSYVSVQAAYNNNNGYPINVVTFSEVRRLDDRATLGVFDPSRNSAPNSATTNSIVYLPDFASHSVGTAGDCLTANVYPIIPWMLANAENSWNPGLFACVDATGRLVRPTFPNTEIDAVASEDSNAYVNDKHLDRNAATKPDITVQSLYLNNANKNKYLGTGRTLTVKSGGLILQGASAIGLPGRTDNGALVLGDASHPAYVWARAYGNNTNYLGAAVTAAGGFVAAYPGNLALVGDQTGIADEIAVNAGTLSIGTAAADCSLADGLSIRVCAGATLLLPTTENAVEKSTIKLDGFGENFAKVILPVDQKCAKAYIRDQYEGDSWEELPAGTYGSSASGAAHVDDDRFAGTGKLTVGGADAPVGMMFMVY